MQTIFNTAKNSSYIVWGTNRRRRRREENRKISLLKQKSNDACFPFNTKEQNTPKKIPNGNSQSLMAHVVCQTIFQFLLFYFPPFVLWVFYHIFKILSAFPLNVLYENRVYAQIVFFILNNNTWGMLRKKNCHLLVWRWLGILGIVGLLRLWNG